MKKEVQRQSLTFTHDNANKLQNYPWHKKVYIIGNPKHVCAVISDKIKLPCA